MASSSLFNGERAVVLVFISRVLFSLPFSLLLHGLSLSLLALSAFVVEIRAETSASLSIFKTRPGASSGILLGAVTLPVVMLSKLIQLSRAFALHEVALEELEYSTVQYWATSASSLSVLVFLYIIMLHAPDSTQHPGSHSSLDDKFTLCGMLVYVVACGVSLLTTSHTGFIMILNLLWVLCHGLAAVKLIRHFLNTFPSCASIGEALLVTTGLVLYFGDMLACTIVKAIGYISSSELGFAQYGIKRSEITTVIQGVILGLLLFPVIFKFVVQVWECSSRGYSEARTYNEIGRSFIFFSFLGVVLVVIIPSWMQFVNVFNLHPLLWVISFVFSEPLKRLSLCIYWVCVIYVSVLRFYNISKNSKIERILLRKYYHLMAVLMFLPALIFQPKFLDLAFGAALAVFLALEIIRVWRIWPLGQPIHQFMNAFTDHRDSDLLIVSHFSLLLGCALPIWMSSGYNDRPLTPFAGILSLGIGDTMP
ncbi:dolichol kinase EVAN isoform X2 [Juglans regia]|uniref:dolichol kinase n=1 Tax=Juglans regia TaxID=51240 RepID=A0A6P9E1W7_JUGRE|nr:dolichol kinase EVAN isoform X2 [Juglans regia]